MNKEQAQQLTGFSKRFKEATSLYSLNTENFLSPYEYGEEITDFVDFFYSNNLVSPDYLEIQEELTVNRAKPEWYAGLCEKKAIQSLCCFIRGDRFCDGLLASGIQDGTIPHLLERIKVLHGL